MTKTYYDLCSDAIDDMEANGKDRVDFSKYIIQQTGEGRNIINNDCEKIKTAAKKVASDKGLGTLTIKDFAGGEVIGIKDVKF
jgi:hypothetical protein